MLRELALLNSTHDVFLVLIDSAFAFELPAMSAGWIEVWTSRPAGPGHLAARRRRQLAGRVREWQDEVEATARDLDLDVVRIGLDRAQSDIALGEFVAERRLRKRA